MTPTVGIQAYVWIQIFEARGQALEDHLDEAVASVVASGITTFEPGLPTESFARRVGEVLPRHGVTMPTMYAGGTLHTPEWQAGVEHVLTRARWGKAMGARTVVVNPNPIQWGKPFNKSDEELTRQARALQMIGEQVRAEPGPAEHPTEHERMVDLLPWPLDAMRQPEEDVLSLIGIDLTQVFEPGSSQ